MRRVHLTGSDTVRQYPARVGTTTTAFMRGLVRSQKSLSRVEDLADLSNVIVLFVSTGAPRVKQLLVIRPLRRGQRKIRYPRPRRGIGGATRRQKRHERC